MTRNSIFFICLILVAPASRATEVVPPFGSFDRNSCQDFLTVKFEPTPAARVRAARVISWFSLDHPTFRRVVDSARDLPTQAALFHLAIGFASHPRNTGIRFFPEVVFRQSVRFYRNEKMTFRSKLLANRAGYESLELRLRWINRHWGRTDETRYKTDLTSSFLRNVFLMLREVVAAADRSPLDDPEIELDLIYPTDLGFHQHVNVDLNRAFSRNDLDDLRRLLDDVHDVEVRAVVVDYVFTNLEAILANHGSLCATLATNDSPSELGADYALSERLTYLSSVLAEAPRHPIELPYARPATLPKPIRSLSLPDDVDLAELDAFVGPRGNRATEDVAVPQLHRDLHRAVHFANELLQQLAGLGRPGLIAGPADLDRIKSAQDFSPTFVESLRAANDRGSHRLKQLTTLAAGSTALRRWLNEVNESIKRFDAAEAQRLSGHEMRLLQSALALLPRLWSLLQKVDDAIQVNFQSTVSQSDLVAELTILTGSALLEGIPRGPTDSPTEPAFAALMNALRALESAARVEP